jgi:glycosyltransferase involved in cell wall biosynthesis
VPLRDACALQAAIAGLLQDPERWTALRSAALATAAAAGWDGIAAEAEAIYAAGLRNRDRGWRSERAFGGGTSP